MPDPAKPGSRPPAGQNLPDRYDFLSDNGAGMCPEAVAPLIASNIGFVPGYGADETTRLARDAIQSLFDADAEVRFVATGTAANALACAVLCRPFEAMLAHDDAHIRVGEAGASGFFGQGVEIRGIAGQHGKMDPDALEQAVMKPDAANRQNPAAISITNVTEYGTLYRDSEVERLCAIARSKGLGIHIDGARLANAVAAGFDPRILAKAGTDIAVLGGSKAGSPFSEAIIFFNGNAARRFDSRLKQAGQLVSKSRFMAAPWIGLLDATSGTPPLIAHALHANAMARRLTEGLPCPAAYPVDANMVFVPMNDAQFEQLAAKGWRASRYWGSARFVCSWATTGEAVEELRADLQDIL